MKFRFIRSSEKKKILSQLNQQFGITSLPFLLIETGKDKFRGFSGSLSKDEIASLSSKTNIESLGLYLLKKEHEFRLSIEATQSLSTQITKNTIEINNAQLQQWLRGLDLQIKTKDKDNVIIKYQDDFIGSGKSNMQKIFNYIPKDRRLKN